MVIQYSSRGYSLFTNPWFSGQGLGTVLITLPYIKNHYYQTFLRRLLGLPSKNLSWYYWNHSLRLPSKTKQWRLTKLYFCQEQPLKFLIAIFEPCTRHKDSQWKNLPSMYLAFVKQDRIKVDRWHKVYRAMVLYCCNENGNCHCTKGWLWYCPDCKYQSHRIRISV